MICRDGRCPIKLAPVFKDYLWGGERLKTEFDKQTDLSPVAESWECSTHPDGECIVAQGRYEGMTLTELLKEHPDWLGTHPDVAKGLPVLIKLIDAESDLSVQVHPDDGFAWRYEGQPGKTEMWYVIDAKPGAQLVYGFKHEVTAADVRKYIEENTLIRHLQRVEVHKGDVFFIPPGTVHAIGAGALIAEIQQSSNVTYRLYDYGRRGADGKLRELHIEKALAVMDMSKSREVRQRMRVLKYRPNCARELLGRCKYFQVERLLFNGGSILRSDSLSFIAVLVTEGAMCLEARNGAVTLKRGECAFIPADCGEVRIDGFGEAVVTKC